MEELFLLVAASDQRFHACGSGVRSRPDHVGADFDRGCDHRNRRIGNGDDRATIQAASKQSDRKARASRHFHGVPGSRFQMHICIG